MPEVEEVENIAEKSIKEILKAPWFKKVAGPDRWEMGYYLVLLPKTWKGKGIMVPCIVKVNERTGYLRPPFPVDPAILNEFLTNLPKAIKEAQESIEEVKDIAIKVEMEKKVERIAKRLSQRLKPEELELLKEKLEEKGI